MSQRTTTLIALVLAMALVVTACGNDDLAETVSAPGPADDSTTTTADDDTGPRDKDRPDDEPVDLANWRSQRPECQDGPDRTITHLEPVVIPAIEMDEIRVPDETIAGHTVPGFVIPAVNKPEVIVDTGCIIEHHAPAGCLPAMEISGVEVPEVVLPAAEIPAVVIDGEEYPARVATERRVSAREQSGRSVDQRCQRETRSDGGIVTAVIRPAMVRPAVLRPAQLRQAVTRRPICIERECTSSVSIPLASIPVISIPAVSVEGAVLEGRVVEGTPGQVFEQEKQTTYEVPSDVFFAFDSAELAAEAAPALEAIARQLSEAAGDARVTVEGHTDSVGDDAYNLRLSEQRAEAVAAWLIAHGGIDAGRLTTHGYGSAFPVAPNETRTGADNPEGRAQNRRVTITVASG